jgi:hypothetical protein
MADTDDGWAWEKNEEHWCGCCGVQIGRGSTTDPLWCARCKPHIRTGTSVLPIGPWDRTYFAQHRQPCPYQEEM